MGLWEVIAFSGCRWKAKESIGRVGPGPNFFGSEGVWVDARGDYILRFSRELDGCVRKSCWTGVSDVAAIVSGFGTAALPGCTIVRSMSSFRAGATLGSPTRNSPFSRIRGRAIGASRAAAGITGII